MWSESIAHNQKQINTARNSANKAFKQANKNELGFACHIENGFEARPATFAKTFEQRAEKLAPNKCRKLLTAISTVLCTQEPGFFKNLQEKTEYLKDIQGKLEFHELNHSIKRLLVLGRKHNINLERFF